MFPYFVYVVLSFSFPFPIWLFFPLVYHHHIFGVLFRFSLSVQISYHLLIGWGGGGLTLRVIIELYGGWKTQKWYHTYLLFWHIKTTKNTTKCLEICEKEKSTINWDGGEVYKSPKMSDIWYLNDPWMMSHHHSRFSKNQIG